MREHTFVKSQKESQETLYKPPSISQRTLNELPSNQRCQMKSQNIHVCLRQKFTKSYCKKFMSLNFKIETRRNLLEIVEKCWNLPTCPKILHRLCLNAK